MFPFWAICGVILYHFLIGPILNPRTAKKELLQHCVVMLLELLFKGNATLRAHAYINVSSLTPSSPCDVWFFSCGMTVLQAHLTLDNLTLIMSFLPF